MRYRTLHNSLMDILDDIESRIEKVRGSHYVTSRWHRVSHIMRDIKL